MVVSDQTLIVILNSKSGALIRNIMLTPNYLRHDAFDMLSGQGDTNFAFSENCFIVFHNQRNFPIAADVLLFQ